jgi:hypothetical protein
VATLGRISRTPVRCVLDTTCMRRSCIRVDGRPQSPFEHGCTLAATAAGGERGGDADAWQTRRDAAHTRHKRRAAASQRWSQQWRPSAAAGCPMAHQAGVSGDARRHIRTCHTQSFNPPARSGDHRARPVSGGPKGAEHLTGDDDNVQRAELPAVRPRVERSGTVNKDQLLTEPDSNNRLAFLKVRELAPLGPARRTPPRHPGLLADAGSSAQKPYGGVVLGLVWRRGEHSRVPLPRNRLNIRDGSARKGTDGRRMRTAVTELLVCGGAVERRGRPAARCDHVRQAIRGGARRQRRAHRDECRVPAPRRSPGSRLGVHRAGPRLHHLSLPRVRRLSSPH